jgi:alkaline phosphatase
MKRYLILALVLLLVFTGIATGAPPRNVILMIGDGMGFEQVKAAGMYKNGTEGTLVFETFPYRGEVTTYSASSSVTDSAAAATAIATGFKVNNDVVSVAIPGDGHELQTLLEYFKALGKSTGLVTTTFVTHATPACFGAHEASRNNYSAIAGDYLNQTRPNVLFGGGANGMSVSSAQDAGYTVVTNAAGMLVLDTETATMVSGQFGSSDLPYEFTGLGNLPHLSQMAEIALFILDNDPDGFFLMIEGGLIDKAGHANNIQNNVWETIEFGNAVQKVVDWAAGRTDTLIIVTADHETGGLTVLTNNGVGVYPTVHWSTGGHTGVNVPVYAWGANAHLISGAMDNTDFFAVATAEWCAGDFIGDRDVDGSDLAEVIIYPNSIDLATFAQNFGKTACPH